MSAREKLLIVLTNTAKRKLNEKEYELETDLQNLDSVCLYKYPDKRKIALPVNDGQYTLLLIKDNKGENYFLCIGVLSRKTNPSKDNKYRHQLPLNIECILLDGPWEVKRYIGNGIVDHSTIFDEVELKEDWRPSASSNIEERKWKAYLDLYKKIINEKKVSVGIANLHLDEKNQKMNAELDESKSIEEEQITKITEAIGEYLQFSLFSDKLDRAKSKRFGRLINANNRKISVKLDKNFQKSLKELIRNGNFQIKIKDKFLSIKDIINKQLEGKEKTDEHTFYFNDHDSEPIFTAKLKINNKNKEGSESENVSIDTDTIKPLKLNLSADFISDSYQIKIMQNGLREVKELDVWQVLSGERVAKLPKKVEVKFDSNSRLNKEQKEAVKGALGASELFLIWGPPGTGKTETIQEIAKQEALRGNKTLICSQSNLAVDNALARLSDSPNAYPFRIAKDGYEMEGEDNDKVPFINSSGLFFLKELQLKLQSEIEQKNENYTLQKQFLKRLKKAEKTHKKTNKLDVELREFEQHSQLYCDNINIVGTTLMESGKTINKGKTKKICDTTGIKRFDTVIIDEVSKATPPELFIPIALGKKLILVGDHKQLPPMFKIISGGDEKTQEEWAEEADIDKNELDIDDTIFERLWKRHTEDASPVRAMLTKQYRMHPEIQKLIEPFYKDSEGTLSFGFGDDNKEAIDNLTLNNIAFCKNRPTMWVRTKEKSLEEKVGTSFINEDEINNVEKLLKKLSKENDKELSVGVITFYGAQLKALKDRSFDKYKTKFGDGKLIFGTVDRFQGRECDVIICSLVRNNKYRRIGFASKVNRINVAFSRARKSLIILASAKQFCHEGKNTKAQKVYKYIYDKCNTPQPKELD